MVVHIGGIWLEKDTNGLRFVDDVTIREDVALGVHNDAGAKRALTDGTAVNARTALAAEESVEEIFHAPPAVFATPNLSAPATPHALYSPLRIDVCYARLQLLH